MRKASRREPILLKKTKLSSPKNTTEAFSLRRSPEGTKPKNRTLKSKQTTPETNLNEVTITDDLSKTEVTISRQGIVGKCSPKEQTTCTKLVVKEGKRQSFENSQKEKTPEDPQKKKPDRKRQRLPPSLTSTEASDLITLLACTREVIGDHEYSSDQD